MSIKDHLKNKNQNIQNADTKDLYFHSHSPAIPLHSQVSKAKLMVAPMLSVTQVQTYRIALDFSCSCPPSTCQQSLLALPLKYTLNLTPTINLTQITIVSYLDCQKSCLMSLFSTLPLSLNLFSTLQESPLQKPKTDHVISMLLLTQNQSQ